MNASYPHLTGLLWDMDGTLVDSEPYWEQAESMIAKAHNADWTLADRLAVMGTSGLVTGQRLQSVGVPLDPADISEILTDQVIAQMRQAVPWQPGALKLLNACRDAGLVSALVTMSHRRYAQIVADAAPTGCLNLIVAGNEVERGKPDPQCFNQAAAALAVPREGLVVLEDSPNGVAAGLASGLTTVAIPGLLPIAPQPYLNRVASLANLSLSLLDRMAAGALIDELSGTDSSTDA
jgi:HAD superfamily hydrolase (TIGR01509 family)